MKKILKIIGWLLLPVALYLGGVILYGTITDWQPPARTSLPLVHSEASPATDELKSFDVLIWNIGFGGLGAESDFFYDGGKSVRQEEKTVLKNEQGIRSVIKKNPADFYLFQEVDRGSKRSYDHEQYELLQELLPGFDHSFANNYKVNFVPLPLTDPLGKVNSGVATFSTFPLDSATRYSYATQFEWPRRVFFLDRCFLSTWIDLPGSKDLLVINTHNTAYDLTGELSKGELTTLLDYASPYAEQGHYVMIGGDWNRCPPNYEPIDPDGPYREHLLTSDDLPKGWKWVADISKPTNRKLTIPYDPELSYTSCIDHYLLSPGLTLSAVETVNTDFAFSDHQPVKLTFGID